MHFHLLAAGQSMFANMAGFRSLFLGQPSRNTLTQANTGRSRPDDAKWQLKRKLSQLRDTRLQNGIADGTSASLLWTGNLGQHGSNDHIDARLHALSQSLWLLQTETLRVASLTSRRQRGVTLLPPARLSPPRALRSLQRRQCARANDAHPRPTRAPRTTSVGHEGWRMQPL